MLGWFLRVAADVAIFAFGGKIPYERRARHIATARLYVSIAAVFVAGIGAPVLIFETGDRLDEPMRATFTSVAGWAYLLVLAVILVAYVRRVRRTRRGAPSSRRMAGLRWPRRNWRDQMTDDELLKDGPLPAALARDDAAWAREHIERDAVAWLTTVAPDGRVQSSPISFLREGTDLFFYSQPDTPKLRNMAHSSLVSLHLQSDPYGDHWLIIEGTAVVDATIPPLDVHERYRAKYREPHAHWGLDFTQTARDFSVPIRIRPTRVRLA